MLLISFLACVPKTTPVETLAVPPPPPVVVEPPPPPPPRPTEVTYPEGLAAKEGGDLEKAGVAFDECVRADAAHLSCQWELGLARFAQGRYDDALVHTAAARDLLKAKLAAVPPNADGTPGVPDPTWPPITEADRALVAATGMAGVVRHTAALEARSPVPAGTTLRLRAVGDLMIGSEFPDPPELPPNDAADVFAGVADLLQDADFTFGNLEGPLCDSGVTQKCAPGENCYAFRSPTRYADLYKAAGFDVVSTANNHAEDFGVDCRVTTEAALDRVGIAYSGRPGTFATFDVKGVRVGVVGFHTSTTGHYVNDPDTAALLVRAMSETHDIVIVSFHGGAEGAKAQHVAHKAELFYNENRGDLRSFVRTVISAGADLVIGHGPHVLRGLELVDGHLVAYSLGNFATYGKFNLKGPLGVTAVLEVTLDGTGKFVSGQILPVKQVGEGVPEKDPSGEGIGWLQSLSEADFPATAPKVSASGAIAPR